MISEERLAAIEKKLAFTKPWFRDRDENETLIAELLAEVRRFRDGIAEHRSQLADDRCIEDDDRLYELLGDGIKCDRRVGSIEEMHANCWRFLTNRCEGGGPWKSYAELQTELMACQGYLETERAIVAGLRKRTARFDELLSELDRLRTALPLALKAIDEAYTKTGHIRVAKTSVERLAIEAAIGTAP